VRRFPALTRLLAVLLLLQWGTAFAHCLRLAAPDPDVLHLALCTPDGLRTVAVGPDGQQAPQEHGAHAGVSCPACLGPGEVAPPVPEVGFAPPLVLAQAADPPPPAPPPVPQPPRSCQPRAPPTS
jgi:hypothetical protein